MNVIGTRREDIAIGMLVEIVKKQDQSTGELTEGFIKRILTKARVHPHGIKVMLKSGEVGRVKGVIED